MEINTEQNTYGHVTVGHGTSIQREVKIKDFLKASFKDDRMASISSLEDETFVLAIENYQSSGRSNQNMLLSKESLLGLLSVAMLYFQYSGMDFTAELNESLGGKDEIEYQCSENLLPKDNIS